MTGTEDNSRWRRNRWRIAGWGTAAIMLLLPFISMQFTDEVDWSLFDFIFFGSMLGAAGGTFELAARMTPDRAYRAAAGVALAAAFILIWVNGAVGIIGNEENPANLMFYGVLAIGIIGAVLARHKPGAMARAMVATAIAQAMVAVIALIAGLDPNLPVTVFFVAWWCIAAWLFSKSDRESTRQTK